MLSALCASVVSGYRLLFTTEAQRTQRLHREDLKLRHYRQVSRSLLDLVTISQRLIHRYFVHIFEIASHRHAHRNARYAQAERLK